MSLAACDERCAKRAHLRCHHREAAAGVAGAGRLDGGIERQQIGLPRDLVDHPDDVGNLAR